LQNKKERQSSRCEPIIDVPGVEDPERILENLDYADFALENLPWKGKFQVLPNQVGRMRFRK